MNGEQPRENSRVERSSDRLYKDWEWLEEAASRVLIEWGEADIGASEEEIRQNEAFYAPRYNEALKKASVAWGLYFKKDTKEQQ